MLLLLSLSLIARGLAGKVLWDGRCNNYTSASFLDKWSWPNQVGEYQWYIHGSKPTSQYVALSTNYKNPADTSSKQGLQLTIDNTSFWNGQNMRRTELIPQTTAPINKGKVFYHFSMQINDKNTPSPYEEHQICFFESHFTEMKYGLISGASGTMDTRLQWMVSGQSKWSTTLKSGEWHNIAYGIDFDSQTVAFYHSTGSNPLQLTINPVKVSTSSNGADWHLGILRLPSYAGRTDDAPEDWHFSGVYIESGSLTTSVVGP